MTDLGNPPEGGAPAVPDVRDARLGLLKNPVKPVPAGSFPATPGVGDGSSERGGLNIAVKSPRVFAGEAQTGWVPPVFPGGGPPTQMGPGKNPVNSPGRNLQGGA